jgi:hypothetical protein
VTAAEDVGVALAAVAGLFGDDGRVTRGLAELAVDGTRMPDGTPRRTAGKHSRFTRAR